ncbi:hypothetical protein [Lysinibacillus sp. 3P01SB]|uniref:hypothetical protein n=1 Tax=Lysinibacillus sp. 3P01SB TaxID=3132284 RepID=UPI0039A4C67A
MHKKNFFIMSLLSVFLISSFMYLAPTAHAASGVIVSTTAEAAKIGSSFETTSTLSRSEVNQLLKEVKRLEEDANLMNSIRFGAIGSLVTAPLKRIGLNVGAGAASGVISYFVINKDFGSTSIQNVLNKSTASNFKVKIKYVKKTRGRDVWYQASTISITAA